MQHLRLFKFIRVNRRACDERSCIYAPFFLPNNASACYLARLLMYGVGSVACTGFIVFVAHRFVSYSQILIEV